MLTPDPQPLCSDAGRSRARSRRPRNGRRVRSRETVLHLWMSDARSLHPRRNRCLLSGEQPESRYFAASSEAASRLLQMCRGAVLAILRSTQIRLSHAFPANFEKFQPGAPIGERCPNSALIAPSVRTAESSGLRSVALDGAPQRGMIGRGTWIDARFRI